MARTRRKRFLWMTAVGLVLIAGSVFYIRFFLARPIGSGPAGPPVDRSAFKHTWTERPVRLVGIGDSITAGFGADSPDHSFFGRLVRNPGDEFAEMRGVCLSSVIANLEVENIAISGSTSKDHEQVVQSRLSMCGPDVFGLVVITTGGNDLIHSYGQSPPRECAMYGASLAQAAPWIEAYKQRLGAMLNTINARFPGGCEIYLGDIYDPTDGMGDAPSIYLPHWPDGLAIHARYNRAIVACAAERENVYVVPLHESFLGHGAHCRQFWRSTYVSTDPFYWYYDNVEDPNDRGHDAVRRLFLNAILKHTALRQG